MEEQLSAAEKLALRHIVEDTLTEGGSFDFGEPSNRVIAGLWPKLAEAIAGNETFSEWEQAFDRLVAEALDTPRKGISAEDAEYTRDVLGVVRTNARETYCELRGIPCEAEDRHEDAGTEGRGLIGTEDNVRYVNFGGQQHSM